MKENINIETSKINQEKNKLLLTKNINLIFYLKKKKKKKKKIILKTTDILNIKPKCIFNKVS